MKNFVTNLLLFMLPIFIFGMGTEVSLRHIPNDYSYKKQYLDKNSDQLQVLFLGSSHAYRGINPEFMGLKSFNASYISQTLDYDYAILKKYDKHWSHLKYIVIPISYFSLYTTLQTGVESWRSKNYTIYYDIQLSNRITDHSELLSNTLSINLKRIYYYYFLNRPNITCSMLGFGLSTGLPSNVDLVETGKIAAARHTVNLDSSSTEKIFVANVEILKAMIAFADQRDIEIILYTPPAYRSYVKHLDKRQLEQTISTATQLDNLNANVIYVNFLSDESFVEKDFLDGDHLNSTGAEKLTKILNLLITNGN